MSETVRLLPGQNPRVETGPIQFGNDWPGIFIRGDNALYHAHCLNAVLERKGEVDMFTQITVEGLNRLLASCQVGTRPAIIDSPSERRFAELVIENERLRGRVDELLCSNNERLQETRDLRDMVDGVRHENVAAWSMVDQQNVLLAEAAARLNEYREWHEGQAFEHDRYGPTSSGVTERGKATTLAELIKRLEAAVQPIAVDDPEPLPEWRLVRVLDAIEAIPPSDAILEYGPWVDANEIPKDAIYEWSDRVDFETNGRFFKNRKTTPFRSTQAREVRIVGRKTEETKA